MKMAARKLRKFGFEFDRHGPGSHEIYRHAATDRKVTLPHHAPPCVTTHYERAPFPLSWVVVESPTERSTQ